MIEVRLRELGYANFSPYIRHLIRVDFQNSRSQGVTVNYTVPNLSNETIAKLAERVAELDRGITNA